MIASQNYVFAVAALGAMLSMSVTAHHMSGDPDFVEEQMPADALEQHTLIVDEVLDMGIAQMAGTLMVEEPTQTGEAMDPADMGTYSGPGS